MPGSYEIEWQPGDILLMRRSGFFTVPEAEEYVGAAKDAMATAPEAWGLVVDVRAAPPQSEEVQAILTRLMRFTVSRGVRRTAVVAAQAVTNLQQKRITTKPGLHDRDAIAFHSSIDDAFDDVRQALA